MILLALTLLSTGLITGLLYAYSCSVNTGLGKLSDKEYLTAMQSINRSILNPAFFVTFFGTLVLLPICSWFEYSTAVPNSFYLFLFATIIYTVGVFGVTVLGNVPLNNNLDNFDIKKASLESISKQRVKFESPWNRLHLIRTIASIISFGLLITAVILH
jgi:uncharacterized membrane protein